MTNLTIITRTERGTTFKNLSRKITMIEGVPHAKVDGSLLILECETFNGKPVAGRYTHTIAESTGSFWY